MTIPKSARLQFIKRLARDPIELKQLVAVCCVNWGLSRRTILEDIQVLVDFGSLKQNGQTIQIREEGISQADKAENAGTVERQKTPKKN